MVSETDKLLIDHLLYHCRYSNKQLAKITELRESSTLYRVSQIEKTYFTKYDGVLNFNIIPLHRKWYFCKSEPNGVKNSVFVFNYGTNASLYCVAIGAMFFTVEQMNTFEKQLPKDRLEIEGQQVLNGRFSLYQTPILIKKKEYPQQRISLVKQDILILSAVAQGGARDSLMQLVQKTKLSYDVVRYRFKRLMQHGYFLSFVAQPNPEVFAINIVYLYVESTNTIPNEKIMSIANLTFCDIGANNKYLFMIVFESYEQYIQSINDFFAMFGEFIATYTIFPITHWERLNEFPLELLCEN